MRKLKQSGEFGPASMAICLVAVLSAVVAGSLELQLAIETISGSIASQIVS